MEASAMDLIAGLLLGLLLKDNMLNSAEAQTYKLPKTIKTVEGSCVVIPCEFTSAESKPVLKWLRYTESNRREIYNSNNSVSVLQPFLGRVSLVGDPAKGNCTVKINNVNLLDGGPYFPQIGSDPPTAEGDGVLLSITDTPDPITISGPETLIEGSSDVFTCVARHTCPALPPTLRWNFRNLSTKTHHRELSNGVWETVSKLTYKADSADDGKILKCLAEYTNRKRGESLRTLRILYPPKMVSVQSTHETGQVRKGDKFVLICQGNGNPNITNYTWYKNNETVLFQEPIQDLYIDGMTEDKSGQYYCVAGNEVGETKSEPITLLCINCETSDKSHVKGAVGAAVVALLIILAVVLVIWYRKKKNASRQKNASRPPKPTNEVASMDTNTYVNVMAPHNPRPFIESPYAALQTDNRCPDYEQLQLQDHQASNKPPLHTSPSYSEYEEVIPFRSQQNKKWKK